MGIEQALLVFLGFMLFQAALDWWLDIEWKPEHVGYWAIVSAVTTFVAWFMSNLV